MDRGGLPADDGRATPMTRRKAVVDDAPSDALNLEMYLAETASDAAAETQTARRSRSREYATPSQALLIDAPALAGMLSVSEATLYRMLAGGKIPAPLRLSRGCVRWHRETVERWLAASEAQGRLIDRASWETLCASTNGKPR